MFAHWYNSTHVSRSPGNSSDIYEPQVILVSSILLKQVAVLTRAILKAAISIFYTRWLQKISVWLKLNTTTTTTAPPPSLCFTGFAGADVTHLGLVYTPLPTMSSNFSTAFTFTQPRCSFGFLFFVLSTCTQYPVDLHFSILSVLLPPLIFISVSSEIS